jgi:hypothetical protein
MLLIVKKEIELKKNQKTQDKHHLIHATNHNYNLHNQIHNLIVIIVL